MQKKILRTQQKKDTAAILRDGGILVMSTDTIYGIVALALRKATVMRLRKLRHRSPKKPMIILIGDIADLSQFGVRVSSPLKKILPKIWPGRVSVVMEVRGAAPKKKFAYLHRGTNTIAFRLPRPLWLRNLLREIGPLAAPSANFEGEGPAATVREARRYFGNAIEGYVDGGRIHGVSSTLIRIVNGKIVVMRKGSGRLPKD